MPILIQTLLKQKLAHQAQARQTATGIDTRPNGKWIMNKESLGFLFLDAEIKLKLREGKTKKD
jgi:hypothetical protein